MSEPPTATMVHADPDLLAAAALALDAHHDPIDRHLAEKLRAAIRTPTEAR